MMRRRSFLTLLGGAAAAWPVAARAQQGGRVRWIGLLQGGLDSDPVIRETVRVFEQSLEKLGWPVGRNLAIDYRWGANDFEKARIAMAQVLRLPLDVIVVSGGPSLMAAQQATATVGGGRGLRTATTKGRRHDAAAQPCRRSVSCGKTQLGCGGDARAPIAAWRFRRDWAIAG